jgi:hypothetical protein
LGWSAYMHAGKLIHHAGNRIWFYDTILEYIYMLV